MKTEPDCADTAKASYDARRVRCRVLARERYRVLTSLAMSCLSVLIVLLLGHHWALGYLYLAKAPVNSTGCLSACAAGDLIVTGSQYVSTISGHTVSGYNPDPFVQQSDATRDDKKFTNYPCLPLPPEYNTWGPPYQQDEGYWSVGNAIMALNTVHCNYLVGQIQSLNGSK